MLESYGPSLMFPQIFTESLRGRIKRRENHRDVGNEESLTEASTSRLSAQLAFFCEGGQHNVCVCVCIHIFFFSNKMLKYRQAVGAHVFNLHLGAKADGSL